MPLLFFVDGPCIGTVTSDHLPLEVLRVAPPARIERKKLPTGGEARFWHVPPITEYHRFRWNRTYTFYLYTTDRAYADLFADKRTGDLL